MTGPTLSPDGRHYWDGQRWVQMPRPPRSHRKAYTISGSTLILLLLVLGGILFIAPTPLQWDCTVEVNGANMQVEYTGVLAGAKCDSSINGGFARINSHFGSQVCRYPIGLTNVTVWDTGFAILGTGECSQLKTQYDQAQSPSARSP